MKRLLHAARRVSPRMNRHRLFVMLEALFYDDLSQCFTSASLNSIGDIIYETEAGITKNRAMRHYQNKGTFYYTHWSNVEIQCLAKRPWKAGDQTTNPAPASIVPTALQPAPVLQILIC